MLLHPQKCSRRTLLLPVVHFLIGADTPRQLLCLCTCILITLVSLDAQNILIVSLPKTSNGMIGRSVSLLLEVEERLESQVNQENVPAVMSLVSGRIVLFIVGSGLKQTL